MRIQLQIMCVITKHMDNILSSASKIVFIMMAFATVVLTYRGVVDPKDFMMLTGMAFSFYFANKGEPSGGSGAYLGK